MKDLTEKDIQVFLREVNADFPVPLSEKVDLDIYAEKLLQKATLCCEVENEAIVAMVAGYTDNISNGLAYIALVATLKSYRGKGLARKLVNEFLECCKQKSIKAVHLYTHHKNLAALRLYADLGFAEYVVLDEKRPCDVHLIYYL